MFNRYQESKIQGGAKNIAILNPSGGDISARVMQLAQTSFVKSKKKDIIVESPCLGIPRLVFAAQAIELSEKKSIDQLLLDYERKTLQLLKAYTLETEQVDLIPISSQVKPDLPTLFKLKQIETLLQVPLFLKENLTTTYGHTWFALQGQLIHPLSMMSLRIADVIVLAFDNNVDLIWAHVFFRKLIEDYGIDKKRIIWYADKNNQFKEVNILSKPIDVLQRIAAIDPFVMQTHDKYDKLPEIEMGLINPKAYINVYTAAEDSDTEISTTDEHQMHQLVERTRVFLRDHYGEDYVKSLIDESSRKKIRFYIEDYIKEQNDLKFSIDLSTVIRIVQREITEMGHIQPLLDDSRISSIEINSPTEVIVEKDGFTEHWQEIMFHSKDHMYRTIGKMLTPMGKTLTANDPVIDSNYRGFRINVTLDVTRGGISANYPIISIRKFPPDVYSHDACIQYGNCDQAIIDFLQAVIPAGANIEICGGTNSGKTSTLMRLPLFLDPLERILTVEDSEEMMLKSKEAYKHYPNMASFVEKWHEEESKRYDSGKIIKGLMRQNPDVIIIGEIRDSKAADQALIAANTGHIVYFSVHANSAADGATRMVQLAGDTKTTASRVVQAVDLVIYQEWIRGKRIITEISELMDYEGAEKPIMNPIFIYDFKSSKHVQVGKLKKLKLKMLKTYRDQPEIIDRWCHDDNALTGGRI